MKYAVTGSNGYLGRRLVSYLKSKGHDVLALSHARADQAVDQHAYFDLVDGVRTDVLRDCDVQGFYLLFLLFLASYQFSISLKTTAYMLFLLFQQPLLRGYRLQVDAIEGG